MSVVVAVKDSPQVLLRCLSSLEKYAPQSEVILVDDGSELSETITLLESFQARNHWIIAHHAKSLGHSRSCETGARLATRPYLCFLNSDAIVTPWSWFAAKEAFEADDRIGVIGPSTSSAATPQMIRRAMHCRYYWNESQICAFAKKHIESHGARSWVDLSEVGGFAFFIRRSLWEQLGGFDPNLPDYGNESELCRRVAKHGFRNVWTQNSYIHHLGHQSYGRLGDTVILHRARTARKYINEKHA